MQGAQKRQERGVYEKYVERGDCQRNAAEVRFSTAGWVRYGIGTLNAIAVAWPQKKPDLILDIRCGAS